MSGFVLGRALLLIATLVSFSLARADESVLDDRWQFRIDAMDEGMRGGWAAPGYDDAAWDEARAGKSPGVPGYYGGSWTASGYYGYSGVAWYRKRLNIPRHFRGKFLVFHGVQETCTVYFDGMEVAHHGPSADPRRRGIAPGATPFRVRLPADRDAIVVALRVVGNQHHFSGSWGPGLVDKVALSNEVLMQAGGYWLAPDEFVSREEWLAALREERRQRRRHLGVDGRIYTGEFAWVTRNFVQGFAFVFDTAFYDPVNRRYRLDEYLDDGIRRFGGYDNILLWHSYPNLGVDEQNQFEMLRNLPGGVAGLARMIERAHARGVKVFIPYNPWDTATRQEPRPHAAELAAIVAQLQVDGVILDVTPNAPSVELRNAIDRGRPGVVLQPEGGAGDEGVVTLNSSWSQSAPLAGYFDHLRGIPISKWTEPRHIPQADGDRWRHDRTTLLQDAFLNGSGVVVWENIFGTWNRFTARDAAMLRRMSPIQRRFSELLTSDAWEPFVPTLLRDVDGSFWPGARVSLWTLVNWSNEEKSGAVLRVKHSPGTRYYDVWNGEEIRASIEAGAAVLPLRQIEGRGIGAIVATRAAPDEALTALLANAQREAATQLSRYSDVWEPPPAPKLVFPGKTARVSSASVPQDMALIPQTQLLHLSIEHNLGEGGCYPDEAGAAWEGRAHFTYGAGNLGLNVLHQAMLRKVPAFLMDRTLVTKQEYLRFLAATAYRPQDATNFLKDWDWTDRDHPKPPAGFEDHPVVWVDLDDARAFLRWANKRLPTEHEWQYAAGGVQQRRYPWGETWQAGLANDNGARTTPVTAFEQGGTPEGLYDMSGNVWQWTESERNDGNRYVMLRGGSYFQAGGSPWYFDRYSPAAFALSKGEHSARPTDYHVKLFLLSPGADRKATIGFRGVRDVLPAE